jgi:hypothetical protein
VYQNKCGVYLRTVMIPKTEVVFLPSLIAVEPSRRHSDCIMVLVMG